jgi:CheY-like chemotaxis protein
MFDILVVDDDRQNRIMLRMVLQDAGYTVSECSSGECAVVLLRTHPQPLIVVLDWLMPGFDGEQVLRAMMEDPQCAGRHAYILVTAAGAEVPLLKSLPTELDVRMLRKPFDLAALLSEVGAAGARIGTRIADRLNY